MAAKKAVRESLGTRHFQYLIHQLSPFAVCDWMSNMMHALSLQIFDALLFEGDEEAKEERELVEVNEQV